MISTRTLRALPTLFRVGFGIKRKGGVKPLK